MTHKKYRFHLNTYIRSFQAYNCRILLRLFKCRTADKTKSLGLFICVCAIGTGCFRPMYLSVGDIAAPDYEQSVLKYLDSLENVLKTIAGILL